MNQNENLFQVQPETPSLPKPQMQYKGIFIRFLAITIDEIILGIVLRILFMLLKYGNFNFHNFYSYASHRYINNFYGLNVYGLTCLYLGYILCVATFTYYVLMEWKFGATIGKMMLGIKVVKCNGEPLDFKASLIRNTMRVIDSLPVAYIVGIISILNSDNKQRVGDRIAETVVISNKLNN